MLTDPYFYVLAVPAVILLGLAKGGFSGVSVISVPLMALAVSPVQAAAITLPILMVQDVVSVWAFRRTWHAPTLMLMLPAAALGVFLGYALAAYVAPAAVELAIGVVSVAFAVQRLWVERAAATTPKPPPKWFGAVCGAGSGFTSQIFHAGGPPFQIYALPLKLERDVFIGTSAIFFAAVNWMKAPAYFALGQFTRGNMATAAVLLPLAIASTIAGVVLVRRVDGDGFYKIIYWLLVVVGLKLVYDGARAIWF